MLFSVKLFTANSGGNNARGVVETVARNSLSSTNANAPIVSWIALYIHNIYIQAQQIREKKM